MKGLILVGLIGAAIFFGYRHHTESSLERDFSQVLCESNVLETAIQASADANQRTTASDSNTPGTKLGQMLDGLLEAATGNGPTTMAADAYFTGHPDKKSAVRSIINLSDSRRKKVVTLAGLKAEKICPQNFQNTEILPSATMAIFRSASR